MKAKINGTVFLTLKVCNMYPMVGSRERPVSSSFTADRG